MKYFGALVLLGYGVWTYLDPDLGGEGRPVPGETRRGPGGSWLWYGGLRGGK